MDHFPRSVTIVTGGIDNTTVAVLKISEKNEPTKQRKKRTTNGKIILVNIKPVDQAMFRIKTYKKAESRKDSPVQETNIRRLRTRNLKPLLDEWPHHA